MEVRIKQDSVVELLDSSNSGQSGLRSRLLPTMLKFFYENNPILFVLSKLSLDKYL